MAEQPELKADWLTHQQHLQELHEHTEALRQWSEQLQALIDESERLHRESPIGQYRAQCQSTGPILSPGSARSD
ncbi:hypothetical protein [Gloeobacter violaceus]|uniref:hypothetical protein n=1 Tax=Gloeobacter violaceus TaxID=33072 RepID=UPI0013E8C183|nr:hypothetical protein [Gloeobacter violaceus]